MIVDRFKLFELGPITYLHLSKSKNLKCNIYIITVLVINMAKPRTILFIGVGDVGEHWIQFAARVPGLGKIIACDLKPEREAVIKNAVAGAMHQGYSPDIEFRTIDLFDVEKTTDLIKDIEPEGIVNSACVQSWWEIFTLPREMWQKLIPSIIGGWLMMHISTSYSLMKAVKAAGYYGKIPIEITTLPDIVAPALAKVGLAPTCGGGNAQLRIPRMKQIVGEKFQVPMSSVKIWQIGEHGGIGTPDAPVPWFIKIVVNGEDVTNDPKIGGIDGMRKILFESGSRGLARMNRSFQGVPPQQATAAAFLSNFVDILWDTKRFVGTMTGIKGLIGGYPVRLGRKVELALPKEISLAEAKEINWAQARMTDGLEDIKSDGSIVITDAAHKIQKEVFDFDHKEWTLEENVELALDLTKRFRKLKARFA